MPATAPPRGHSAVSVDMHARGAARGRRAEGRVQVSTFACDVFADAGPQALGLTYWFDTEPLGDLYSVRVRFSGRRIGVKGRPSRSDRFEVVETVDHVVPGSGPVALTVRVNDVADGDWHVTATATREASTPVSGHLAGSKSARRLPSASTSGKTAFAPLLRILAPGARLGAWPALVSVGVAVALVTQQVLAARRDLPPGRVLLISLLASAVGAVGAKLYYLVEHRDRRPSLLTAGMCIQGFVLAAIAALVVGTLVLDLPIGTVLDATTPGLLFGMTIGRFGCFFGGCCAGRPSSARWALWSSDRRLGVRRLPTQLAESAVAFAVGCVAFAAVWSGVGPGGAVFVAAIATYTIGRQLLFPLRNLPRHTAHGRRLTTSVAAAALTAAIAAVVLA